jgi:hypothetical protein
MFSVDQRNFKLGNSQVVYGPGEHLPGKAFALFSHAGQPF